MRVLSFAEWKLALVAAAALGWGAGLSTGAPALRYGPGPQLIPLNASADQGAPVQWYPQLFLRAADGPLGDTPQSDVAWFGHRAAILEPQPRLERAQRRHSPRESWRGGRRKVKWVNPKGVHETPAQAPLRLLAD